MLALIIQIKKKPIEFKLEKSTTIWKCELERKLNIYIK